MRQIRKMVANQQHKTARAIDYRYYHRAIANMRSTMACDQTHLKEETVQAGKLHLQCMNAIKSPTKRKKQKCRHVKTSPSTQQTTSRHKFSPITVPGTPEHAMATSVLQTSADNPNDDATPKQSKVEDTDDELEDIDLYYKAFNRNKPEPEESNAESVSRHQAITAEYRRLKLESKQNRIKPETTLEHSLTPHTPINTQHVQFQAKSTFSSPITMMNGTEPIIELMSPEASPTATVVNNVQEMSIDTDHSLYYANPDRTIQPQSIDLIYDTGAAISMMPAQYNYACRNLRDCLHSLAGCFYRTDRISSADR